MPEQVDTMDKREAKNLVLPFEIKAIGEPDANGMVEFEGYAAAFDNVDLGNDVIVKGAFVETMKADQNWPIYLDHHAAMENTAGYNVSASEDSYGLRVKGQLNTKVEAGRIAYELAKQAKSLGKNIGLSIGYGVQDREIDPDTGVRKLKKLRMYEYSFTNHPMNTAASFTNFKSRHMIDGIKQALRELIAEEPELFEQTKEVEEQEEETNYSELISSIKSANQKVRGRYNHA